MRELNVDVIYAVPGQTAESWSADLERVLRLGSEHLSAYNLTFEEDTVFRRWLEQGRLAKAHEDVELELFTLTRERTRAHGFEAYEISNFARDGHACEHNLNYWRNGEYLGIGPSAVSKQGTKRIGNAKAIGAYVKRIHEHGSAAQWEEDPPARTRLAESWWLGLRLSEGVSAAEAARRAAFTDDDAGARALAVELEGKGLLERAGERWRLNERGLPLADWVAKQFLARVG